MSEQQEYTRTEKRLVLLAACAAIFVNPLAGSMLNLALGSIQDDFLCSEHSLGWISSIYFIVSVMALLPTAKLADIYGKRTVFLVGIVFATAGFILSAFSQNIYQLYVFRGVTAIGTAAISGTSVSMIASVYPPNERGGALGINTACIYLGGSLGPVLGGVMTEMFGWKSIFIFLLPFVIVGAVAMLMFRHNFINTPGAKFDIPGSVVYAMGILVMMFGVLSLPEMYAVAMIVAGLAVIIAFIFMEKKVQNPIFKGSLFKSSTFSRSMLALFLNYTSSFCISFVLSRYLQEIGALTPSQAGLYLMAQPAVQVVFTLVAGKMSDTMDKRILPTLGMAIICVGLVMLLFLGIDLNVPLLIMSQIVIGMGFGIFSAPNTNAIMSYVSRQDFNAASGLISVARQMGMMLSIGLATCLIAIMLGTDTMLVPSNYSTFIDMMKVAWGICLCMCVIGTIVSWFRGSSKAPAE